MTATGHLGLWRVLITEFVQVFCCSFTRQAATDLVQNTMVETVRAKPDGTIKCVLCAAEDLLLHGSAEVPWHSTLSHLMVATLGLYQSNVALNQRSPLVEKYPSLIGCPFPCSCFMALEVSFTALFMYF